MFTTEEMEKLNIKLHRVDACKKNVDKRAKDETDPKFRPLRQCAG